MSRKELIGWFVAAVAAYALLALTLWVTLTPTIFGG